jgi:hypothetical protein
MHQKSVLNLLLQHCDGAIGKKFRTGFVNGIFIGR